MKCESKPFLSEFPFGIGTYKFRLTVVQEETGAAARRAGNASFFTASHLFTLPYSWKGQLFSNVVRLQMSELSQDYKGLALEQMVALLKSMPGLRRLGTLSTRVASLMDLDGDNCHLEELVVANEMDDVPSFFKIFLTLEKEYRRCSLQRLAVHMRATDGCRKFSPQVEGAICAGWYQIANTTLKVGGAITFSADNLQSLETVPFQLPWFAPRLFGLDKALCLKGELPISTPLDSRLPFNASDSIDRPTGTLVTGEMRPLTESERAQAQAQQEAHIAALLRGERSHAPQLPPKTGSETPSWFGTQLGDAMELLAKSSEFGGH